MKIWAHRGASGYAPENSLESFKLAAVMGADGVELDVQLSKDNKLIVIHDEYIDRVSDGHGLVRDYTLKELQKYNYNRMHPEYEHASIVELEEVLDLLKPTQLSVNIELKTGICFYRGIEDMVLRTVKNMGMEDRVLYSSFNHYTIRKVKEMSSQARTGILYSIGIYEPARYAAELGADALHPRIYEWRYPRLAAEASKYDKKIHVWTIDTLSEANECLESGCDAIITNYPDKMLQAVRSWCERSCH